jgi:hypothetical protein
MKWCRLVMDMVRPRAPPSVNHLLAETILGRFLALASTEPVLTVVVGVSPLLGSSLAVPTVGNPPPLVPVSVGHVPVSSAPTTSVVV